MDVAYVPSADEVPVCEQSRAVSTSARALTGQVRAGGGTYYIEFFEPSTCELGSQTGDPPALHGAELLRTANRHSK